MKIKAKNPYAPSRKPRESDFIEAMRYFQDQIEFHRQGKADRSELKELIVEMRAGFKAMDRRFDDLIHQMDKRFEAVDKRFEAVDKRFEAVDKRFEAVDKRFEAVDKRFDDLIHQMDKRFEDFIHQMDKRFDDLIHQMDKRFEAVDRRFAVFQWVMGVGFATTFSMLLALLGLFLNTPGQAG